MSALADSRRRLRDWLDNREFANKFYQPVYKNPPELKADLRVVLDALDESLPENTLIEVVDGLRVVCWICKESIKPQKASRALCAKCATGGGLGPYT